VRITSGRPVTVRLRAVVRASRKGKPHTGAKRRVRLAKAGKRSATLHLNRRTGRALRHRHASFRVLWRGGGRHGVARVR